MNLFKKIYDYKKDFLQKRFVLSEKKYFYFYQGQRLTDEDLSQRSKKILKKENAQLVTNPTLLVEEIQNAKANERFLFLKSQGYPCHSFKYLGLVEGTMSPEMETFLTNLTNKENVLLGIHRVQYTPHIADTVADVLTKGLILSGHINSGYVIKNFTYGDLSTNISYYPDNKTIISELMYANAYKNSIGSFLIEIPDEKLHSDDLFYADENNTLRLNPKYIIGFVPTNEKHHLSSIIRASDLDFNSAHRNNRPSEGQIPSVGDEVLTALEGLANNLNFSENGSISEEKRDGFHF